MRDMFGLTLLSLGVTLAEATVDDVRALSRSCSRQTSRNQFRGYYATSTTTRSPRATWPYRGVVGDVSQMALNDNPNVHSWCGGGRHALERQPCDPQGDRPDRGRPQADRLLLRPRGCHDAV